MAEKTYLITFDPFDLTADVPGFLAFLQTTPLFDSWWNHIPGVFMVTSEKWADEISAAVRLYTKKARMLVVEVNPVESDGWLSDAAWSWVRSRSAAARQDATPDPM
jgi:hypothetical protein